MSSFTTKEGISRLTLDLDPVQMALTSAGEVVDTSSNNLQVSNQRNCGHVVKY